MARVFVYGTLLRGGPNAHHLLTSSFVCEAQTASSYFLISNETSQPPHDLYKYPYLMTGPSIPTQTPSQVRGELYDVDAVTLKRLDELEGAPEHYRRQRIEVITAPDSRRLEADTYILEHEPTKENIRKALAIGGDTDQYKVIEGGDWRAFIGGYPYPSFSS